MTMNSRFASVLVGACIAAGSAQAQDARLERGKYMVLTGHCNNSHTAGYAQREGNVPEKDWLLGSGAQGWRGPWGTTYPVNLRLYMRGMTEAQWVKTAKTLQSRPPMPWFALHDMTEPDLRALYHYIQYLGWQLWRRDDLGCALIRGGALFLTERPEHRSGTTAATAR